MVPDTTKVSLILRLGQPDDHDAWSEFVKVYQPVIYWAAKRQGLQSADADEVVQKVLSSISTALQKRPHDHERAKFRTWLFRVTQNAVINTVQRQRPDRSTGDTATRFVLDQLIDSNDEFEEYELAYERSVFRWAASKIKPEFHPETWTSFWKTMVEGETCESVAAAIGKEIGSIYAARSRVMKRLKEKVQEFDDSCQM